MKNILILLLAPFIVLTSCSYKKTQRQVHEQSPNTQNFLNGVDPNDISLTSTEKVDLFYENKSQTDRNLENSRFDVYQNIVKPLKDTFFNEDIITRRDHENIAHLQTVLHYFNKAIIRMIKDEHSLILEKDKSKNLLIEYLNAVRSDCSRGRITCNSVAFFKQDSSQSYKITLATTKLLINEYNEYKKDKNALLETKRQKMMAIMEAMSLSLHLKSIHKDVNFDEFFVAFNVDYRNEINALTNTAIGQRFKRLAELQEKAAGIIPISNKLNKDSVAYADFLKKLKPFRCSQKITSLGSTCSESLFIDSANRLFTNQKEANAIFLDVYENDKENDKPLLSAEIKNLSTLQKKVFQINSDLESAQKIGEKLKEQLPYLILIDRIFEEHWTINQASVVWKNFKRAQNSTSDTVENLAEAISFYLKIKILSLSNKTLENLKRSLYERNLHIQDRFQKVLDNSDVPSMHWGDFVEKTAVLKSFLELQFNQGISTNEKIVSAIRSLDTLPQNLKNILVYPSMVSFASILRNDNLSKLTTFDKREVTIDENTPHLLLLGRASPWFLFGTDPTSTTYSEAMFAAYFLFKSGFIHQLASPLGADHPQKNISSSEIETLDDEKILNYLVGDLFITTLEGLKNVYRDIESTIHRSTYQEFERACRQIKNKQPITYSPFLMNLQSSVFSGYGITGMMSIANKFYSRSSNNLYTKFLEVRDSIQKRIRLVELLRISYESHLEDLKNAGHLTVAQKQQKLARGNQIINSSLTPIIDLQAAYVGKYLRAHNLMSDCIYDVMGREVAAQEYLKEKLDQYFQKVYIEMAKARGFSEEQVADLKNKGIVDYQDIDVTIVNASEHNYHGYPNMITHSNYQMSKLDILLKVKEFIEAMPAEKKSEIGVNISEVALPPDLRKIELFEKPKPTDIVSIQWQDDYSSFKDEITKILFRYSDKSDHFLGWAGTTTDISFIPGRIEIISELYLLGKFEIINPNCELSDYTKCPKELLKVKRDTLVNEFKKIRDLIHIDTKNEKEVSFLATLGRTTRYPVEIIRELFFKESKSNPNTFMENIFDRMSDEILTRLKYGGTSGDNRLPFGLGFINQFYVAERDAQKTFFSKSKYMEEQQRDFLRREYINMVTPTVEMLSNLESLSEDIEPLSYSINGDLIGRTQENSLSSEAYLKKSRIDDFKRFMKSNFFVFTNCKYTTQSSDKDLKNEGLKLEKFFGVDSNSCR